MTPIAIDAHGVGKCFEIIHEKPALVRAVFPRWFRPVRHETVWALRDVSFRIPSGASVALVGPNGAGKSTLLNLLAGVSRASEGRIEIQGKVTPLLTLGVGFHPELTGEDNLWLSATLYGMDPRDIRRYREEILAFAGLNGLRDVPLTGYSAGMRLRLGFAIALYTEFDVLLIDEVLTVGDASFQYACIERLKALRRAGKTLVFVTQDLALARRLAETAFFLERGRLSMIGPAAEVVRRYEQRARVGAASSNVSGATWSAQERRHVAKRLSLQQPHRVEAEWGKRLTSPEVEIREVRLLDHEGHHTSRITAGSGLTVAATFDVHQPLEDPHIGIALFRSDRTYVFGPNTRFDGERIPILPTGEVRCTLAFDAVSLAAGDYRFSVVVWERFQRRFYAYDCGYYPLQVRGVSAAIAGVCAIPCEWAGEQSGTVRRQTLSDEVQRQCEAWLQQRAQEHWPDFAQPSGWKVVVSPSDADCTLQWGAPLEMMIELTGTRPYTDAQCWVGLIRDPDGLLCAGWATWESGCAVSGSRGVSPIRLRVPRWPLTAGRYHIAVCVWDAAGALVAATDHAADVYVRPGRPDHGLTYLPHRWTIQLPTTP